MNEKFRTFFIIKMTFHLMRDAACKIKNEIFMYGLFLADFISILCTKNLRLWRFNGSLPLIEKDDELAEAKDPLLLPLPP
jgi:hypothetical protein